MKRPTLHSLLHFLLPLAWTLVAFALIFWIFELRDYIRQPQYPQLQIWCTSVVCPTIFGLWLAVLSIQKWDWNPNRKLLTVVCLPMAIIVASVSIQMAFYWNDAYPDPWVIWLLDLVFGSPLVPFGAFAFGYTLLHGLFANGRSRGAKTRWMWLLAWCCGAFVLVFLQADKPFSLERYVFWSFLFGLYLAILPVREYGWCPTWSWLLFVCLPMALVTAFETTSLLAYVFNLHNGWLTNAVIHDGFANPLGYEPFTFAFALVAGLSTSPPRRAVR